LISGAPDEPAPKVETAEEGENIDDTPKTDSQEKTEDSANKSETESKSDAANEQADKNATNTTNTTTASSGGDKKPKPVLVKEPLGSNIQVLDVSLLDGETLKTSVE